MKTNEQVKWKKRKKSKHKKNEKNEANTEEMLEILIQSNLPGYVLSLGVLFVLIHKRATINMIRTAAIRLWFIHQRLTRTDYDMKFTIQRA